MKISSFIIIGLISFSTFASDGGIKDRKTKSIITVGCADENCLNFAFFETNQSGERTQLSQNIERAELLKSTKVISEETLDGECLEPFEFSRDQMWSDYKAWWNMKRGGSPVGALLLSPAALPLIAASFVIEGAIDGVDAAIVNISNAVKSHKLTRAFENQIGGDQEKVVELGHKNYEKLKNALSNIH